MNILEKKGVIILICVVAFVVALLMGVTYFVYFTDDDVKSKGSNSNNQVKTKVVNNNNQNQSNMRNNSNSQANNYRNNANSLMDNIEVNKAQDTGILDNVRQGTHRDYKGKQVFNISNNIFTYEDAEAACKVYGAELATYQQVMDSYKKGAEWCNYGWSDKQMALYPTQKDTWEKLQQSGEDANSCGTWGVNGGYFENPNTLFGANCYGIKPAPKNREQMGPPPQTQREGNIAAKVARFREEKDELTIGPFNKSNWSQK